MAKVEIAQVPISVRVREACRLTGIGRSKLYELIAAREIDIVKVGTITLIPVLSLARFIEARQCTGGSDRTQRPKRPRAWE